MLTEISDQTSRERLHHHTHTAYAEATRQEAHEHADALLAQAQDCVDAARADDLRREAVVLTLDLADTVAMRYRGRGIDSEDLVQVGRMALVKAAQGYRVGCGSSFAAYAVPTISGEIKRHFRDCGWAVRPPRRLQELRAQLATEEDLLRHRLQREPSTSELARALGLDRGEIQEARACSAAYRAVSLDAPVVGRQPIDVVERDSDHVEQLARRDALGHAIASLAERERLIIRLRFVEERTQSEIGQILGVSQMQVSRLLSAILARLRHDLTDPVLAA
jgi:RNA polymerase sigma-B factor